MDQLRKVRRKAIRVGSQVQSADDHSAIQTPIVDSQSLKHLPFQLLQTKLLPSPPLASCGLSYKASHCVPLCMSFHLFVQGTLFGLSGRRSFSHFVNPSLETNNESLSKCQHARGTRILPYTRPSGAAILLILTV